MHYANVTIAGVDVDAETNVNTASIANVDRSNEKTAATANTEWLAVFVPMLILIFRFKVRCL